MELIDIIKDFAFYNTQKYMKERNETKSKKDELINRINSLHYTSLEYGDQLNYTGFIFQGNYPNEIGHFIESSPQIYCDFCIKCGNYQQNLINNKVICHCIRTIPRPCSWHNDWALYWKS